VPSLPDSRTLPSVTDTRQLLCRVSHSAKRTRPFFYRRSRHCRVPFFGHSANLCRVPSRTRQKKVETGRTTANWRTERANGTNGTAERDGVENFAECQTRGTRQRFKLRRVPSWQHSAKFRALPSAATLALGEVWLFAECHAFGTRRSFKLRRVTK